MYRERDLAVMMTGAIKELLSHERYFYDGYNGHLTDEGCKAAIELLNIFGSRLRKAREMDLDDRAKVMVVDELRGKK